MSKNIDFVRYRITIILALLLRTATFRLIYLLCISYVLLITSRIRHIQAKCILLTAICHSVCVSSDAFLHYCTHPSVTLRNVRGYPLVMHYWLVFKSAHGFCCYGNRPVCIIRPYCTQQMRKQRIDRLGVHTATRTLDLNYKTSNLQK